MYVSMEIISQVSTHAGQNHKLCLGAHGHLPGTLRYAICDWVYENLGMLQKYANGVVHVLDQKIVYMCVHFLSCLCLLTSDIVYGC